MQLYKLSISPIFIYIYAVLPIPMISTSDPTTTECKVFLVHRATICIIVYVATNGNSSTVKPKSLHITSSVVTLVTFPTGIKCESAEVCNSVAICKYIVTNVQPYTLQQTEVNTELQKYIMSKCNCTNIAVISTLLECRSSSQASYSVVIVGEDALLAAVAFNYSLNNEEYLTTEMGIKFSAQEPSIVNSTTTSVPNSKTDDDITIMHLNILLILTVILLILGLITGFATGWYVRVTLPQYHQFLIYLQGLQILLVENWES